MPASGWNGRFQGVGGSGYSAGATTTLTTPVNDGYSASVTDGGHTQVSPLDGSFVLDDQSHLN
jgi:feruloyl esterase